MRVVLVLLLLVGVLTSCSLMIPIPSKMLSTATSPCLKGPMSGTPSELGHDSCPEVPLP